jgi:SAM-dependent methyltransferase
MNMTGTTFEGLTPPEEKMRKVGPIFDAATYINSGRVALERLRRFAYLRPDHSVVDIGSGYGRVAIHLAQFLNPTSQYTGFEIVKEETEWCRSNISTKYNNFEFVHLDVANKRYNVDGRLESRKVIFKIEDNSIDTVFLISVFTHMFPSDVENYLREISRILRVGGAVYCTFFMMNEERKNDIERGRAEFKFAKQTGGYWAVDGSVHEGAIAHSEQDVYRMLRDVGLSRDKVSFGGWSGRKPAEVGQDFVVATKSL